MHSRKPKSDEIEPSQYQTDYHCYMAEGGSMPKTELALNLCNEPTCCAYSYKLPPRGPYLQYKVNYQNNCNKPFEQYKNIQTSNKNSMGFDSYRENLQTKNAFNAKIEKQSQQHNSLIILNDKLISKDSKDSIKKQTKTYIQNNPPEICSDISYPTYLNKCESRKYNFIESSIKLNHDNQYSNTIPKNEFLQRIQKENFNTPPKTTKAKVEKLSSSGLSGSSSSFDDINRLGHNNDITFNDFCRPTSIPSNQINYITLADVIRFRPEGLNEIEGWAVLCQSVQALQDLFLADTPSISRILPLVRPSTVQITSRGRIIFNIGPSDKFNDTATFLDLTAKLSPEYIKGFQKRIAFSESDIEKMWVYSLGLTLQEVIKCSACTSNIKTSTLAPKASYHAQLVTDSKKPSKSIENSLERVLIGMCEPNPQKRFSLMILLDLHPDRGKRRRLPQLITSLNPKFNPRDFNFNKVNPSERMFDIFYDNLEAAILINQSPLTKYHCLICPRISENIPQIINIEAIKIGVRILKSLKNPAFRIGYNSPGALASVNHLHLHLLWMEMELYIEKSTISNFCQIRQQLKPFSHIVIEIFDNVIFTSKPTSNLKVKRAFSSKSFRNVTCSDKNSIKGEKYLAVGKTETWKPSTANYIKENFQNNLKVRHDLKSSQGLVLYKKNSIIGYADVKSLAQEMENRIEKLQVLRRKGDKIKHRESVRRNTIDISVFDVEKAHQYQLMESSFNVSKSNNYIDKLISDTCKEIAPMKSDNNSDKFKLNLELKRNIPEFIKKSSLPSRQIDIIDNKCSYRRIVSILLLDGQILQIMCNALVTTAIQIFETVVKSENFLENYLIGLCALIGGDFVFLPPDLKIYKVAPHIWANFSKKTEIVDDILFTLFIRIKFFLPTLRGISSLDTQHMIYLQLRKSILEKHILSTEQDLILLGGLALQAELGDFKESMKHNEYFTVSHYLPEGFNTRNKEIIQYLRSSHFTRKGLNINEAEQNFIKYVQEMKDYGFHLFSAVWLIDDDNEIEIYIGISLGGISIFKRNHFTDVNHSKSSKFFYQRKKFNSFEWLEIEKLFFSKHILCIVTCKTENLNCKHNNRTKYKMKMDGRKSYFAFSLASEHHQFYMKLRNSFMSLKSLSNELNIPIEQPVIKDKLGCYEKTSNSNPHVYNFQENKKKTNKEIISHFTHTGNIKMPMISDNRKLKIKKRLLWRSKSNVGTIPMQYKDKEICYKYQKDFEKISKEENQNKENECPLEIQSNKSFGVYSPNRNRVKMGTKVFSSELINRSFDNNNEKALSIYRGGSFNSVYNEQSDILDHEKRKETTIYDNISFRSISLSSIHSSENHSNKLPDTPNSNEAYVIHSSIKSDVLGSENFTLPNETLSESLLEKFNEMSSDSSINDRIIKKITIVKEKICQFNTIKQFNSKLYLFEKDNHKNNINGNITSSSCNKMKSDDHKRVLSQNKESILSNNKFNIKNKSNTSNNSEKPTLGISVVRGIHNNVYVKDLIKNGPAERNGIQIGDQILAVNGISLLNLSYKKSLKLLQNTINVVDLLVSQILMKSYTKEAILQSTTNIQNLNVINNETVINIHSDIKDIYTENNYEKNDVLFDHFISSNLQSKSSKFNLHEKKRENLQIFPLTRSMPDIPKVVALLTKRNHLIRGENNKLPLSGNSFSRKYVGPTRFPVTPLKLLAPLTTTLTTKESDDQVFI